MYTKIDVWTLNAKYVNTLLMILLFSSYFQWGYSYAGLENGEHCSCGLSYGRYGPANNCNKTCLNSDTEICGGFSANSIYKTYKSMLPLCYNAAHDIIKNT